MIKVGTLCIVIGGGDDFPDTIGCIVEVVGPLAKYSYNRPLPAGLMHGYRCECRDSDDIWIVEARHLVPIYRASDEDATIAADQEGQDVPHA